MNRREIFKGLVGLVGLVGTSVIAPVIGKIPEPVKNLIPKFLIARIKTIYPTLLAKELVSVQPMSGPTGQVFYMNLVQTKKPSKWERMKKYILG